MPDELRTPGVYITEKSLTADGIAAVPTGVPAFVGYTDKAGDGESSLRNVPQRISSMTEYHDHFGYGPPESYSLTESEADNSLVSPVLSLGEFSCFLTRLSGCFYLYYGMLSYFENGGGVCYVVSVGDYSKIPKAGELKDGIASLENDAEPDLLVIPDAVGLDEVSCFDVQIASLTHSSEVQSRFTILDVYEGHKRREEEPDCIDRFRKKIGEAGLSYGAAYYPWIETFQASTGQLSFSRIDEGSRSTLQHILINECENGELSEENTKKFVDLVGKLDGKSWTNEERMDLAGSEQRLHEALVSLSGCYVAILKAVQSDLNLIPPSAAIAGAYAMTDSARGVWKAPANVGLAGVIRLAVNVTDTDQEDLNVHFSGKSINAIRNFAGQGPLIWGARTLDGNSLDVRYIGVRRTLIMLEHSIALAVDTCRSELKDKDSWVRMKDRVARFLGDVWMRGGLAGATAEEAFLVNLGLGESMTQQDLVEGLFRMSIRVAIVRPAEYIEIIITRQMD